MFLVKIWLKMSFSWSEIDQTNLLVTRDSWNLSSAGDTSPAFFFKVLKGGVVYPLKKILFFFIFIFIHYNLFIFSY
jgi:hypothetical protein